MLFEAPGKAKPKQAEMEAALEAELGFEVPVFLRSAAQLAKIAALEPFSAKQLKASKGKLQVAFLPKKPAKAKVAEAMALELRLGSARDRGHGAPLASCRGHPDIGSRPEGAGAGRRPVDDADHGHGGADC